MRRFWKRIGFLFTFQRSISFLKDFFVEKEVTKSKKILFAVLIIGYFLFPFDLIPDFLFGLGLVDDVSIAILLLQWMIKMAPQHLKEKYSF
ncbi:YkvA family protein [Virgibacillus salexigens]|uniref:YkvA family protein n=1 Tax=Virgibacillus salexigens TaxID=61016 RepID=UPI00190E2843|nr:DUF1232 domain-containing protein [Virgibacillus salexigens]